MTAGTSAEQWTLLRGFTLLSAEIRSERQNDEVRRPRLGQNESSQQSEGKDGIIYTAVKSVKGTG